MSLAWLFRLTQQRPWLLPSLLLLGSALVYGGSALFGEGGFALEAIGARKTLGIFLLFSLLPAYLVYMMGVLWQRTELVLARLQPIAQPQAYSLVEERLHRLPRAGFFVVLAGVLFGASQNSYFVRMALDGAELSGIDAAMFFGNCFLWAVIGLMLCWRISVSLGISKMGETLNLDLYRLDKLQPLARLATIEILVVAGALAFMPLQSLDASLDAENYLPGMSVGIPAALLLFLLPLWGAHRNIKARKAERLQELYVQQDAISRAQVDALEPIAAHIDRVKGIPNWPIDVQLIARIFAYVVIAPLAWVCAALVEQLLESF